MGTWDKTTPSGTAACTEGDDRIREAKTAIAEALSHELSTFPGASPSTTPIFIPGFLRGATGSRPTGDSLVAGRLYINTTLNVIERYNGSSWDAVATLIPPGTEMLFYQASVPAGWTAVVLNDKFLRVVNGAGTGGTSGGSGLAPSGTITLAHTHSIPSHTHTISSGGDHNHSLQTSGGIQDGGGFLGATSSTDGAHDHGAATGSSSVVSDSSLTDTAFQYADMIVGAKD